MKILIPVLLTAILAGCASPPPPPPKRVPKPTAVKPAVPVAQGIDIDRTTYSALGQSSRVKFVILHYTVSNLPTSIKILTQQTVSSHYLLTDEVPPRIYGLVDETRQSNHAGVSHWKNFTLLNGSSIGIEIVHPGFTEGPNGRIWHPYPQAQIDRLIVLLKDIVARHQIPPENILGHVDIAPTRKQDPGPMFPWYQLAQHGLIVWPDAARVASALAVYAPQAPDVVWFQQRLAHFGYVLPVTGELDRLTRATIAAFQMKYRPSSFDGTPDAHTAAILWAITPDFKEPPPAPPVTRTFQVIIPPAATTPPAIPATPVTPATPTTPAVPPATPASVLPGTQLPPSAPATPAAPPVQVTPAVPPAPGTAPAPIPPAPATVPQPAPAVPAPAVVPQTAPPASTPVPQAAPPALVPARPATPPAGDALAPQQQGVVPDPAAPPAGTAPQPSPGTPVPPAA
nr:N-acetylmuramoyl-L-alanine amidase [Massilia sp. PAMC28688]